MDLFSRNIYMRMFVVLVEVPLKWVVMYDISHLYIVYIIIILEVALLHRQP